MTSILIKNGEIITATDRYHSDVYIENGLIQAIAPALEKPHADTRVIDGGSQVTGGRRPSYATHV